MKITKILAAAAVASLATGIVAATASAYTGYLSFQTAPYSFRNSYDDATWGVDSGYYDSVIVWSDDSLDDPSQKIPEYADLFDWDINAYVFDGGFTDVTIDGDGTYTVSSDAFVWGVDGADAFNFVQVCVDVPFAAFDPNNNPTAFVTSATVYVDGVAQTTLENPPVEGDDDRLTINCANIWNTECPAYTGAFPTESIAVEFTIEGLGAGSSDAVVDTGASSDAAGDKASPDTGVEGVAAVAGLAVVAGGALLLSKKRK